MDSSWLGPARACDLETLRLRKTIGLVISNNTTGLELRPVAVRSSKALDFREGLFSTGHTQQSTCVSLFLREARHKSHCNCFAHFIVDGIVGTRALWSEKEKALQLSRGVPLQLSKGGA